MLTKNKSIIIKFEFSNEQTVGESTKIIGLTKAKYLIPIIDTLDLEANPRSAKTGSVTDAIQESIENDPALFPFKTKGILLASSRYEKLERNRIKISPENLKIEGILDGGHNTLAIGLYILKKVMDYTGEVLPRGSKTWEDFKLLWNDNRDIIDEYLNELRKDQSNADLNFFVPIELLVPRDMNDPVCIGMFKNDLIEVCAARNNNVQLQVSAKANQKGYFDTLKSFMDDHNSVVGERIEWKTNEGGDIKAQDIIALSWIPLTLITPVKDENGRIIEPVSPNKLYSGKGSCLNQFEKLMSSSEVTLEVNDNYKRELVNNEVKSAFKIAVELPELYDYIYTMFPKLYNASGGSYGRIGAVKSLNEKRKIKKTPYTNNDIDTLSPDGFIMPLVYGLQALMEKIDVNGEKVIRWTQPPMPFLVNNLDKIVNHYAGILSICDYDPQKVGKAHQSYAQAIAGFKMAIAGII